MTDKTNDGVKPSNELQAIGQEMITNHPELADAAQMPEPVQRLLSYAGKERREVVNPNITAREAIEIANWIQAAAYGRGQSQCVWTEDDDGAWDTSCGGRYSINEGTPKQNQMRFCTYCGGSLVQQTLPEPPTC